MFSLRNAILLTVLALALAVPGLAQGAPTIIKQTVPFAGAVFHPCTGNLILLSGTVKETYVLRFLPGGGFEGIYHVVPVDVVGVDTMTGEAYDAQGSTIAVIPPSAGATTFTTTFHLALVGSGPTFTVHIHQHGTVNANGQVTVFIDEMWSTCPGP